MEMPICPKCQNTLFRLQAITPVGQQGNVKIQVLSCSQCNTIIGTTGEIAVLDMIAQTRTNASQVLQTVQEIRDRVREIQVFVQHIHHKLIH
jgi:hypothetical protein